jgi:hypothetical protein
MEYLVYCGTIRNDKFTWVEFNEVLVKSAKGKVDPEEFFYKWISYTSRAMISINNEINFKSVRFAFDVNNPIMAVEKIQLFNDIIWNK